MVAIRKDGREVVQLTLTSSTLTKRCTFYKKFNFYTIVAKEGISKKK